MNLRTVFHQDLLSIHNSWSNPDKIGISTGSLYISSFFPLFSLKIRKAFLIQCIYLIDTEVKVLDIIWDVSKTGEKKAFCKLPNFVDTMASLDSSQSKQEGSFPGAHPLMLTISKHMHMGSETCTPIHVVAVATPSCQQVVVTLLFYLTSHFVHSQWKAVYT